MPEFGQLACPMVGGAARFDADQARRQLCKERQNLLTTQCLADDNDARRINCMNLENALGQIKADGGNLHVGGSYLLVIA